MARKRIFLPVLTALSLAGLLLMFTGCPEDEGAAEGTGLVQEQDVLLNQNGSGITGFPGFEASKVTYFTKEETISSGAPIGESADPFIIIDYGPRDELPAEVEKPGIFVMFSQPVVPLAMLGKPSGTSDIMSVSPPLGGVFRWYGTKLLSFESDAPALPQHEYTVTIHSDTRSLGGKRLEGDTTFSFRTEYLSVKEMFLGENRYRYSLEDIPPEEEGRIHLVFSYPVNTGIIKEYLRVESRGRTYPFSVSRPGRDSTFLSPEERERTILISLGERFRQNSRVTVVLEKGARSEKDFLGTPEPVELTFSTLQPFTFLDYDTYSWTIPQSEQGDTNPLYLTFSHPVDGDSLRGRIRTSPPMDIFGDMEVWGDTVKLNNLPVEPETEYTVYIDPSIRDIYGRSLGRRETVAVTVPPARRYAWFPNTGTRMLESVFDPKIVYEYQNVAGGEWKIGAIDDPYKAFPANRLYPYNFDRAARNVRHFEVLDLSPYLNDQGKGFVGVSWNFEERDTKGKRPGWGKEDLMLQVTDLAVSVRFGYNRVIAWVNSISTGLPVSGARVSLLHDHREVLQGRSDDQGLAVFQLKPGEYRELFRDRENSWEDAIRIGVQKGSDKIEFKPNYSHNQWRFGVYNSVSPVEISTPRMETYAFTDRGVYRPGETVTFRGIDRSWDLGDYVPYTGRYRIEIRESRYSGKVLHVEEGRSSLSGGFYGSYPLPEDISPGYYQIVYERPGGKERIPFQVALFRRVGFSLDISEPGGILFQGDTIRFLTKAEYLSGGAVSKGRYDYYWTKEPARYRPPGEEWEPYRFGPDGWDQRYSLSEGSGTLPASGTVSAVQVTTPEGREGMPYTYGLEIMVSDVSNQQVAGRSQVTVHPASFYIGARLGTGDEEYFSPFVEKGRAFDVAYVLTTPGGEKPSSKELPGTLKVQLLRVEWKLAQQQGVYDYYTTRYERIETEESALSINGTKRKGTFSLIPVQSGSYLLRLKAEDGTGREAVTEIPLYSTGAGWVRWNLGDAGAIELVADKPEYAPGETARLLLKSPLPEGTYLVTLEREGIFEEKLIQVEGASEVIDIPIEEEYLPVVYVSVSSFTTRKGEPVNTYFEPDLDKPKGLFGIVSLKINPSSRVISLTMETDKEVYRPGEEVEVTFRVTYRGLPAAGVEITYLAADRGVLDLINYHVPDPVEFFYSPDRFPLGVYGADSRSLLIDPVTYTVRDLQGGDDEDLKGDSEGAPGAGGMNTRKDFRATAVFEPFITTGGNGEALVRFTLPDNLTTYRATAVAVKGNTFGYLEGELKVSNPVAMKVSFPRKLRVRDTGEALVLLTNLDTRVHTVEIGVASDLLEFEETRRKSVTLSPGATEGVSFLMSALEEGTAEVTVTLESDVLDEKVLHRVDIEKPYIYEAFSTIGQTDETGTAREGVIIPPNAEDGVGSLTLMLDATRLSTVREAFSYVLNYPFGCFEQRASKVLSLLLLVDKVDAFGLDIDPGEAGTIIRKELEYWADYQLDDGSFPFWPGSGTHGSYYVTARVGHVLATARERGYSIPGGIDTGRLLSYLRKPGSVVRRSPYLTSYGLYVRALLGQRILSEGIRLLRTGDSLGLSGYAFIGLAFLKNGDDGQAERALNEMKRFLKPGTRGIDLTDTYETRGFYNSRVEQVALFILLTHRLDGNSEWVTRGAATLVRMQEAGRWRNTVDNNWAIQAMSELFGTAEGEEIDYTADVLLGDELLVSAPFHGITASGVIKEFSFTEQPVDAMERGTLYPLSFIRRGTGTLYYTATLRYALPSELLYPRDEGLGVFTEILDLSGTPVTGNTLSIGATYRMKVHLSSSRDRTFLALRVPLPSGAEILDTSFVTTGRVPGLPDAEEGNPWWRPLPVKEILDNEVRYVWDSFPKGKESLEFLFRATSRGVFPTPPATAECMYEPEVFGRDEGKILVIR